MGDVFRALADPTRRTILDELTERNGQTLFEICTRLAMKHGVTLSRQAISQHLDVLEEAGLVTSRKQGRFKFHDINKEPIAKSVDRWLAQEKQETKEPAVRINLTSVYVDDQDKALSFYTDMLGFIKKTEILLGQHRWLTVVSPDEPNGTELLLEPASHPAVKPFKLALQEDGIPFTSFAVADVNKEYERLSKRGVRFTQQPLAMGPVTTAVLDDTCGNLIQIASRPQG